MAQVIVVGGGLAGLSAAHTVLERGGKVILLDKNSFLGGNSTKATSGINGALTRTQIRLGIPDSVEKFYEDTAASARELIRPPLVKVLTGNSASAVEWLQEKFNLDLSLVSRLGGHSFPRTHRGKERFPGMTITYALMEKLEDISMKEPHRARIEKKARATKLLQDEKGNVIGVEYEMNGKILKEYGVVILATGGYAADFSEDGLLKKYRPDVLNLPTTNGDHSTGDGIKMVSAIGGNSVDLEKVQIHPTGLVDVNEPSAKVKFLAAEALRGVGGILLDKEGKRFCDELGHRDYVTGEMWKNNKPPYRLVLNSAAGKEIEWHCKHYMGRGLMKKFSNGEALAKEMGIPVSELENTFKKYNEYAKTNKDPFGKKYFHNIPFDINDEFYVSIVTPVVHFCMGGLEINAECEVLGPKGPIPGLFAAGEVAGGVHGANRLGGSSLLACVAFGRVAGDTASRYLFQNILSETSSSVSNVNKRLSTITNQIIPGIELKNDQFKLDATITHPSAIAHVEIQPHQNKLIMEMNWNGEQQKIETTTQPPFETINKPVTSTSIVSSNASLSTNKENSKSSDQSDINKEWTMEEVSKHNKENDCWVVVNGQVLDVTKFLNDHPGGKKAILLYAGKDATEEFNMLHKPDVVEKYAPYTIIGRINTGNSSKNQESLLSTTTSSLSSNKKIDLKPSNVESWNSGGTADILPTERAKASFNVEKLINFLDGGPEKTKRRRFILSPTEGQELMEKSNWNVQTLLKEHIKHFIQVHESFWDNFKPTYDDLTWMSEYSMFSGSLMNHYGLFLATLEMHGSKEQREWWVSKARKMQIIGCYAQTELGHGSNVRGLRTTAEYDKKTQEFVLNTPTLQSMKWWPGTLGKVATHALVYAQLIIDGKEYGVHSFMVQIRDENHKPLPGIEVGDLGPKLGDNANDTGFMRINNVRIPREFMLSRYQQVTPDGKYIKSEKKQKNSRLHYTTMIFTRASMVRTSGGNLAKAATIATRYSCVRKQGYIDSNKKGSYLAPEKQIIDHQVQRYRIFRQIALAYAIKFTGKQFSSKFLTLTDEDRELKNVEGLAEIAATSGAVKALCTYLAWQGIEDLRKCCGGNGYLMSSGIAPLSANYVWQTTAEGDWVILMLYTAQFLLKALQSAMSGQIQTEAFDYMVPLQNGSYNPSKFHLSTAKSEKDFQNLNFLLQLFKESALFTVTNTGKIFQEKLSVMNNSHEAFNSCALEMLNAVRSHCYYFMLKNFMESLNKAEDKSIQNVLSRLCALFACSYILDDPLWIGLISQSQVSLLKNSVNELLQLLRPDAIALVDAFDIPDRVLQSTIGRYDGNVYEALYQIALNAPLNQQEPFEGYQEYLRPYLDLEYLKKGNKIPSKL